jgi:hypothetical protein
MLSTDWTLFEISKALGLSLGEWDEVHSIHRVYEGFVFREGVAATHPHKT